MRICLLGDFTGTPDEGMKNVSRNISERLSLRHSVLALNSRDAFKKSFLSSIKSFEPEIIHYLHGPTIRSLIILKVANFLSINKSKTIISATRPYFSIYSRWAVPLFKPDLILSQSKRFENFFKTRGFYVKFFPNGVDCQKFTPSNETEKLHLRKKFGLPEDKIIVLHIGHIKLNRNLEIFRGIQKIGDVQVVVVGGTTERADETLIRDFQNSGIIVFHQFFKDISPFYKMADFYVFPLKDTGNKFPTSYNQIGAIDLPLSVLEAMACNLPVISRPFGALPRIFQSGDGLLFCHTDADILNAVKEVSSGLISNTRQKVLPYNWDGLVEQVEKIYQDIIRNEWSNPDFKFINIVGIDGSGKTTLCKKLLREFQKRYPVVQYVHSYHEPFLLKPLKSLARVIFMRGTDEFADYPHYRERKASTSNRHRWLSRIYGLIWILDYALQALCKVRIPRLLGRRLIIDRYVYDAVLNASLTAHLSPNAAYRLVSLLLKILPKPDVVLLIDLPEEDAFSRKTDIQSVEYLRERRHRYLAMADRYGFIKLDGTAQPRELLEKAKAHCGVQTLRNKLLKIQEFDDAPE